MFEIEKVIGDSREYLKLKRTCEASGKFWRLKLHLRCTRRFDIKKNIEGTREDLTLTKNIYGLREGLILKMTFEAHEKV